MNPVVTQGPTVEKLSHIPLPGVMRVTTDPYHEGFTLRLGRRTKRSSFLVGVSEMLTPLEKGKCVFQQ